jgi:ring-1,2-phenylacetyl-CoA epoxidase subunit PaaC
MTAAPKARRVKHGPKADANPRADTERAALFNFVLSLADDALVLGHRLSEWSGRGPMLEEDIALSNLGLDLIGQARLLYAYAGEVEGKGRGEDDLAYLRDEFAFANLLLVEQPNGDFAATMARHLLYAAFMHPYLQAMQTSADARLAEIAAKAVKEMAYHVRHAAEWVIRLGDGTEESHARAVAALDELWMYTGELFEMTDDERGLVGKGIAVDRGAIKPSWNATVDRVLAEATLKCPSDRWMQVGGRSGRHTEHLGHLLAEMQVLHRAHPGATW